MVVSKPYDLVPKVLFPNPKLLPMSTQLSGPQVTPRMVIIEMSNYSWRLVQFSLRVEGEPREPREPEVDVGGQSA